MYQRGHRKAVKLKRTQISLAPEEHRLVQELAGREGVSMSHVIREAILEYCVKADTGDPWERLMDIVGIGDSGNPRSSVDHDDVIYG
ncbi:MAG: CopG family transcriptional regulator [Dehalococcoidia bacterium]|nr:CopG family transcriptional regulator [Dehalococcoidia bacterium]